jgi:hypothetical protein
MDLDKLFTFTDYKLKSVDITTINSSRTLNIWCSPQATTDYYLTGQILWPVSILLGHYVAHLDSQNKLCQKTIVELGAGGTGLPSLLAAKSAKRVVATDGNDDVVLKLLEKNVDYYNQTQKQEESTATSSSNHRLSASQIVWGDGMKLQTLLQQIQSVDVIVAADVVQWPAVVEPLLHTVKALLWTSRRDDDPVFILGIVNRAGNTYEMFFRLARNLGFTWRRVEAEEFLCDGLIPETCQEFGGRETEIIELTLHKEQTDPPVLLAVNGKVPENMTTGSGFEHTSSLPC